MSSNFECKFPHKFGKFCKFLCNYGHLAVIAYGTGCNFCFPLCYRYLKQSIASIPKSFLKGSTLVSFSFIFGLFQTNNTFFYNKSMWKMSKCPSSIRCRDSIPRIFEHESSPITTRPGLPAIHCFLCQKCFVVFCAGQ